MSQAVLPAMREQQAAARSSASRRCRRSAAAASSAARTTQPPRAACSGLARAMAREFGGEGIRVNCITPGLIETDITQGKLTPDKTQGDRRDDPARTHRRADDVAGCLCVPGQRPVGVLHRHHARRERRHVDSLTAPASHNPSGRRQTPRDNARPLMQSVLRRRWLRFPAPPAAEAQAHQAHAGPRRGSGQPEVIEGAILFAEVVKAKSGGRIEVQVAPSAQLGDDAAMVTALRTGALDMSANSQGAVVERSRRVRCLRNAVHVLERCRRPSSCWMARWARNWPTDRPRRG